MAPRPADPADQAVVPAHDSGERPHTRVAVDGRRAERWASTMSGHRRSGDAPLRHAHDIPPATLGRTPLHDRRAREDHEAATLAPGATLASGAGTRARPEPPHDLRTCFERDRDRILHRATAFRRLAGKTQVFIFPDDHQRTRLTHALEVAQVATAIAKAVGANVALTEAIALGHDCGHGPGGHASEDAFGPYVEGGYDHAVWGADVVLEPLNLCIETLDGIRNHSWSRPSPSTPEGEIVSWADRIAYVCHDFEDAVLAGIVTPDMLPDLVTDACGTARGAQLSTFIDAMVDTIGAHGEVAMDAPTAEVLAEFRRFNYEHIYMRPASVRQSEAVIAMLRALVEFFADRPNSMPIETGIIDPGSSTSAAGPALRSIAPTGSRPPRQAGGAAAVRAAVTYVAGMTDRYAVRSAVTHLGWDRHAIPAGVDIG
ncbi:MAG: HD domain-containing protein [Microthrixaceae bacterium]